MRGTRVSRRGARVSRCEHCAFSVDLRVAFRASLRVRVAGPSPSRSSPPAIAGRPPPQRALEGHVRARECAPSACQRPRQSPSQSPRQSPSQSRASISAKCASARAPCLADDYDGQPDRRLYRPALYARRIAVVPCGQAWEDAGMSATGHRWSLERNARPLVMSRLISLAAWFSIARRSAKLSKTTIVVSVRICVNTQCGKVSSRTIVFDGRNRFYLNKIPRARIRCCCTS